MGLDKQPLLSRLRRVVNKLKFLLSFKINSVWSLVSMLGSSSRRRLSISFHDKPGLQSVHDGDDEADQYSVSSNDSSSGSSRRNLIRSVSYPSSSDEDIDKKAEMFIANFRRQLKMERQISLELRYYRGKSFEYNYSP